MSTAKEQAKKLSQDIRSSLQVARSAIARARNASEEFKALLAPMETEAAAARNLVEYPAGRYECKGCHQPVIFASDQRSLPPCESCGRDVGYDGPRPKVLQTVPEPVRKFPVGLYECRQCRAPVAIAEGVDAMAPCEYCGAAEFVAV